MTRVIHQSALNLIIFLILPLSLCLTGCKTNSADHLLDYKVGYLELPDGESFKVYIADDPLKQAQGLSGIRDSDFKAQEGMFFPSDFPKERQFWMPETFFNLDIIFLSEDLYVLDIHKNIQHFVNTKPKSDVPMSKKVRCTHVLEIKADSHLAQKIKHGMLLKWKNDFKLTLPR